MSVILFGAGASFGSGEVEPCPPPLTPGLMASLAAAAPLTWGSLSSELQALFRNDFELGMVELGRIRPDLLPPLQRSMAKFFFNFVPGQDNLYRDLARRIASTKWSGTLVTLNYERLLQLSLEAEGLQVGYHGQNGAGDCIDICVPHGICHLFCDGVEGVAGEVEFAGAEVATGGDPNVVDNPGEFARRIQEDAFPPVMSYFDPAKETTSGVNIILGHRRRFEELVANAGRVVIIGVAVRPEDSHLWQPLAESPADLHFCAGASAAPDFEMWAEANRPGRSSGAYPGYFSESFEELCTAVGL